MRLSSIPFRPLIGSFVFGWREAMGARAVIVSDLLVFGVLVILFDSIFRMVDFTKLPVAGMTPAHMLWHFIMAEVIIVSSPSLSMFGRMIAAGRLSEFAARPLGVAPFVTAYLLGQHLCAAAILLLAAVLCLSPLPGHAPPIDLLKWPALLLALILSALAFNLMTFLVGGIERRGPYSRPLSWLIGKFMFTLGGLFFPVILFPGWLQTAAFLTPFPAIVLGAGGLALPGVDIAMILGMQVFWLIVLGVLVIWAQRRLMAGLLEHGE